MPGSDGYYSVQYLKCAHCAKIKKQVVSDHLEESFIKLVKEEEVALTLSGQLVEGFCDGDCVGLFYKKRSRRMFRHRDGGR